MKKSYKNTMYDIIGFDSIVHVFFYDKEEIRDTKFTRMGEAFERPWAMDHIEEHGIVRISSFTIKEIWEKTSI